VYQSVVGLTDFFKRDFFRSAATAVIASKAKQSASTGHGDCFVAPLLAMTGSTFNMKYLALNFLTSITVGACPISTERALIPY
jgi:hypothetical protein